MIESRLLLGSALGSALLSTKAVAQVAPASSLLAGVRLNRPGPENETLIQRAGSWDVTETVWDHAGAPPVTTRGLVAERRVVGSMLQETLFLAGDAAGRAVDRIDYLTFNRVEGRWDYVSMDTRAPVGIMPAWSFERGDPSRIEVVFEPFAITGAGEQVGGQMLRMTQVISFLELDQDMKEQYFLLADGTGTKWLAHKYEYKRRA